MAPFSLAALFFSFDFAAVSAGLLIRAFVASNDQVEDLKAAIPRGTVLNVNRDGEVISSVLRFLCRSCFSAQISQSPEGCRPQSKH